MRIYHGHFGELQETGSFSGVWNSRDKDVAFASDRENRARLCPHIYAAAAHSFTSHHSLRDSIRGKKELLPLPWP